MADRRATHRIRNTPSTGDAALDRNDRTHGQHRKPNKVRNPSHSHNDVEADGTRTPDHRGEERVAGSGVENSMEVGSPGRDSCDGATPRAVQIFRPQHISDIGIYRSMIVAGAIRPFALPREMETLASDVIRMMQVAEGNGRVRDALKCVELLRLLASDNRELAREMDRIDRLDAGKPTQISGQATDEQLTRIRRIVSTQKAIIDERSTEGSDQPRGMGDYRSNRDANPSESGNSADPVG